MIVPGSAVRIPATAQPAVFGRHLMVPADLQNNLPDVPKERKVDAFVAETIGVDRHFGNW